MDSLKASVLFGWKHGGGRWQVRYRADALRSRLWVFLDASRSTGAGNFLAQARDVVGGLALAGKSSRCHLLVLKDGMLQWKARNATAHGFCRVLDQIRDASGKSLIADGVYQLYRQGLRSGWTSADRILICSDGLVSPQPGEPVETAVRRLRNSLRRLTQSSAKTTWYHPPMNRSLERWLSRLCDGLPVHWVAARKS